VLLNRRLCSRSKQESCVLRS